MRRFLVITIPIITLTLFVFIMLSSSILKKPLGSEESLVNQIKKIEENIINEEWEKVEKKTKELEKDWAKIINRIQFSGERNEIDSLTMSLARLRGAIAAKDKANALIELSETHERWQYMGK